MRMCWPRSSGWTGPITGRSLGTPTQAEAIKLAARRHQTLVWERTRHLLRLRSALREFFPAALAAFADLDAPDTLELLSAQVSIGHRERPIGEFVFAVVPQACGDRTLRKAHVKAGPSLHQSS